MIMKFKILLACAIAIFLLAGAFYLYETHRSEGGSRSNGMDGISIPPPPSNASTTAPYTMAQVTTHAGAQSCWTVIDGDVYDLTQWIPVHPGGQAAILGICGTDGSEAFHAEHDHAQEQESILATFQIGVLAQ